jgi:hypothetical protein
MTEEWVIRLVFGVAAVLTYAGFRHPERAKWAFWWNVSTPFAKAYMLMLCITFASIVLASFFGMRP